MVPAGLKRLRSFLRNTVSLFLLFLAQGTFAANLSGIVYGDGTPLEATQVNLYDQSSILVQSQQTAVSGAYQFPSLAAGTYFLNVVPPANSPYATTALREVVVGGSDVTVDFILISASFTFSGYIRDQHGQPIDGLSVNINGRSANGEYIGTSVPTDVNGYYEGVVAGGEYDLEISGGSSSYPGLSEFFHISPIAENIVVSADTSRDFELTLHEVSGTVTDSNGVPVPGVQVIAIAEGSDPNFPGYSEYNARDTSDANGNYSWIVMEHNNYRVVVQPPENRPDLIDSTVTTSLAVFSDMTFDVMVEGGHTFSGYIRDQHGQPIDGLSVNINGRSANGEYIGTSVPTDVNGYYEGVVAGGEYDLEISGGSSSYPGLSEFFHISPIAENIVVSADTSRDFELTLHEVSGTVTDSNGVPVPGVQVIAIAEGSDPNFPGYSEYNARDTSDANGNYSWIVMEHNNYRVVVQPPENRPDLIDSTVTTSLAVFSDMTFDVMVEGGHTFSGYIRDQHGQPIDGLSVNINGRSANGEYIGTSVPTDVNGYYEGVVAGGEYDLEISGGSSSYPGLSEFFHISPIAENIVVSADTSRDFELTLHEVSGTVTDSNGVPVPGVQVIAIAEGSDPNFPGYSEYNARDTSDANGNYSWIVMEHNNYRVVVQPPASSGFSDVQTTGFDFLADQMLDVVLTLADFTAPLILSGPSIRDITDTSAIIEWETDEPSNSVVDIDGATLTDETLVTHHEISVSGLSANTEYSVSVSSTDGRGNGPATGNTTFRTLVTPDTQAPTFIDGPIIVNITHDRATVVFEADEPVTASISLYQGGTFVREVLTGLNHEHEVVLDNLLAETLYEVVVVLTDAAGNGPTVSAPLAFTTLALPDADAPLILAGPHITDISATGATVSWTTNEPANSGVSYNDGVAYGVITGEDFVTEHQVTLASLTPETLYNATVSSTDVRGNGPTLSDVVSFTTLALPDTSAPTIIGAPLVHTVNHQMALIKWQTDERADSVVLFGLAPTELIYEAAKSSLTTNHSVPVNHLNPATRYYFAVRSSDADGNTALSGTGSFITRSNDPHAGIEFAVPPYVVDTTDTTITVYWRTHQSADSLLQCTDASGTVSQVADGKRKKEHQLTLTGLLPGEVYNCVVTSADQHGNSAQMDVGDTGTGSASAIKGSRGYAYAASAPILTDVAPDVDVPVVTVSPVLSYISDNVAMINWSTDELADALVRYWADGTTDIQQVGRSSLAADHQLTFNELTAGTLYHVELISDDVSGNRLTIAGISFMTDASADTNAPAFSVSPTLDNYLPGKARLSFTTDEMTQVQVRYGITSWPLDWLIGDEGFSTDHAVDVVSLDPALSHSFEIDIIDPAGNRTTSSLLALIVDGDNDGDGINDSVDNCPAVANEDQADFDDDAMGDACDEDDDNDDVLDELDAFPLDPAESVDSDGDSFGDNSDPFPLAPSVFFDVQPDHWAFSFVESLFGAGISVGCGNSNYCPAAPVTRAQMAVFLERGMNGSSYSPPAASGNVFLDVGADDFAASYIEKLADDGITSGCGNSNYCPDTEVTRDQMAVFLLRAKHGSAYTPPPATGVFADVPFGHWAVHWIEQLAAEGITAGCGGGNYCPNDAVTRDQMAVLLVRTFGL